MLEFEKPLIELEKKIAELERMSNDNDVSISDELSRLRKKADRIVKDTYADLAPQQKVAVARHPLRPHFVDYVKKLVTDFTPLAGDRLFGDDHALLGGLGRFQGRPCVIMGQEKGHDTDSRIHHNFGMTRPEGYRKAQRLLALAGRFNLPVITLVDTAGAYPGVGAEERGQSEAIAKSIESCLRCSTPIISVVIGEGGSGGAVAIATANRVLMLEHAVYSVISPEGCASILWRSGDYARDAAEALKLTAQDLKDLGIIDDIIAEPVGGAHRFPQKTIENVGQAITKSLDELKDMDADAIKRDRQERFLKIGDDF
ncbi:MAG: acetyl-CoA carboxylase carboxyltransferase subunit alpha [Alphaproteobacteria bacterium]|nr:MAG: acetyl-CoA carboxylase carboxyltransferase subunit alpha [Alphaproteobacteria bacterium]